MLARNIKVTTDADLARAAQAGDVQAFRSLVDRYRSLVCSIALEVTGNIVLCEDIGQEVFVRSWSRLGDLQEPERFRNWICQIARNLSISFQRKERVRAPFQEHALGAIVDLPARQPSPLEAIISHEEQQTVWRALEGLPEPYRRALELYYREDKSIGRVARLLDLSDVAVKVRLLRGRRMLQKHVLLLVESVLGGRPGRRFTGAVLMAIVAGAASAPGDAEARPQARAARRSRAPAALVAAATIAAVVALTLALRPRREGIAAAGPADQRGASASPTWRGADRGAIVPSAPRPASAPETSPPPRIEVLSLDFEDGLQPDILQAGQVVEPAFHLPGSRYAAMASVSPVSLERTAIFLSPGPDRARTLFRFSDRTVLTFDYWLGAEGRRPGVTMKILDADKLTKYKRSIAADHHEQWIHAEVSFADFKASLPEWPPPDPGDRIDALYFWVTDDDLWGAPLYVDNIRIEEAR